MKTAEEYLNSKGFYNTNNVTNMHGENIKITDLLMEYALEAVKADRERIAEEAKTKLIRFYNGNGIWTAENVIDKQSILNLPIELP